MPKPLKFLWTAIRIAAAAAYVGTFAVAVAVNGPVAIVMGVVGMIVAVNFLAGKRGLETGSSTERDFLAGTTDSDDNPFAKHEEAYRYADPGNVFVGKWR
ncbi:hypothetical protein [Chachezhania sediminis]|uniref:hypothetical protein n=1 Tax=Chachezhania sediminis TaxID=2599291 RepID=UPI00131CF999|nr:hypothetical protein [Chachezhania sediminis]